MVQLWNISGSHFPSLGFPCASIALQKHSITPTSANTDRSATPSCHTAKIHSNVACVVWIKQKTARHPQLFIASGAVYVKIKKNISKHVLRNTKNRDIRFAYYLEKYTWTRALMFSIWYFANYPWAPRLSISPIIFPPKIDNWPISSRDSRLKVLYIWLGIACTCRIRSMRRSFVFRAIQLRTVLPKWIPQIS